MLFLLPLREVFVQNTLSLCVFCDTILSLFSSRTTFESRFIATHQFSLSSNIYSLFRIIFVIIISEYLGLFLPLSPLGNVLFLSICKVYQPIHYLGLSRYPTLDHIHNLRWLHTMAHCALHQGCTRDARSQQLRMEIHKVSHRSFHLWYMSLWGGVVGERQRKGELITG